MDTWSSHWKSSLGPVIQSSKKKKVEVRPVNNSAPVFLLEKKKEKEIQHLYPLAFICPLCLCYYILKHFSWLELLISHYYDSQQNYPRQYDHLSTYPTYTVSNVIKYEHNLQNCICWYEGLSLVTWAGNWSEQGHILIFVCIHVMRTDAVPND